jgi:cytochrome c-type biogenesis protein CcmE
MSLPDEQSARAKPQAPVQPRRGPWKIVISVAVVVGTVGGLLWASTREGAEYYKYVDEVLADASRYQGKRLRVHGDVVEGSVASDQSLHYRFKIASRAPRAPAVIAAEFQGIPPDTFKAGAEVIAAGVLSSDGRLLADKIETKCPSKYEVK